MAEELVLTPGGMRPLSLVHQVDEGESLIGVSGVIHKVDAERSANFLAEGVAETAMMREVLGLGELRLRPEETAALGSGWIAYAYWNNGTGSTITSFTTTWEVPQPPPTQSGQTIFLFNGIQNVGNNFGILQPVLQWGVSAAGGGPYWAVSNWYVTSGGQASYTPLVQVNAGDTLTGVMTLTGQTNNLFSYTSEFVGIEGALTVQNIAELLWCNETLEAYSISQCSDYPPGGTAFTGIEIRTIAGDPSLNWVAVSAVTDCGQQANVASNANPGGEIDIAY